MEFLTELWLPILLSAVGVFVVSSIIHMATPMHKSDWGHLEGEENVLKDLRAANIKPGMYMFPGAKSMQETASPEYAAKCQLGPVGNMVILPSEIFNMGKSLLCWFIYSIVIGLMTAYVANFAIQGPTDFGAVMRLTGTVSTMAYALASPPDSIWKGYSWAVSFRFVIDGILYGLTTGAIFAAMWPSL